MAKIIEVENLTKWYGRTLALDRATFSVEQGQVVGLLGPNGAGKSTAMRILTGFMPASSGTARVAGHDVLMDGLAVRRSVGYMPENVPLYPEMRVEEYLGFRAALKGIEPAKRRAAVDRVVERCWLGTVRRRLIGQLSKGFRQRVGLADALVADPPVLVLDEPTIGLDPLQIRETRQLFRTLEGKHTALIASHILWEVERICSQVIIILDGRIAAAGRIDDLCKKWVGANRAALEVRAGADGADGPKEVARVLGQVGGVAEVRREDVGDGWSRYIVTPQGDADLRESLQAAVAQRGWRSREFHVHAPTLEDLYLKITEVRDGGQTQTAA
ncbi:MAG TPA: ABC transporter ATP-binding protein [Phycisphaerae bacterium]|nr:ABC transporter ATP-binding protein [Phycisphaerae bacterium]